MAGYRVFAVIVYEAEEGGFWADVPELPGCVAQGETVAEVQRNVIEAIQLWLETRREMDSPSEHRSVQAINVMIDESDLVPA